MTITRDRDSEPAQIARYGAGWQGLRQSACGAAFPDLGSATVFALSSTPFGSFCVSLGGYLLPLAFPRPR